MTSVLVYIRHIITSQLYGAEVKARNPESQEHAAINSELFYSIVFPTEMRCGWWTVRH